MRIRWLVLAAAAALVIAAVSAPHVDVVLARLGAGHDCPCERNAAYQKLDFWLGSWDVFEAGGEKAGTNVIEKTLGGCAILENWKDVQGYEGKSVFYYQPVKKQWKQVWITDQGPMKEKALVEEFPDGGVRFQGEIPLPDGRTIVDRTTLSPLPGGKVRQVIEQSADGGKTWHVGFDATYVKQK